MQEIKKRLDYLFNSTKGLILVAIAMIGIVTAVWGMLSGPMAEIGVRDVVVKFLGMDMVQAEREGRIIVLYHSIAMAVIAIETYMITSILAMKSIYKKVIRATITVGYMSTMIFGLLFAYFGHLWPFHGIYIAGLTLIFFAGVMLAIAIWPWNKEYRQPDKNYSRTKSGVDLERTAFFATAVTTLISSVFGAIPGSYFGNGFNVFLAENVIRYPGKSVLEYSIIGHLHIMLALIAIMLTLIIGRWLNFRGILHKIAMPLMILGTIVLNLGVWGVVTPLQPQAHMVIYVGATPSMFAALLLLIWSWDKLIRDGTAHIKKPNVGQKISALLRDPLKFGPTWQMLFMNFTTSFIGIFMAIRLDEIFRVWPAREERIELDRTLARALGDHRHHHPALLWRYDQTQRESSPNLRLEPDHPLRSCFCSRHHFRDETLIHNRSCSTTTGKHTDVCHRFRFGDVAGLARHRYGLAIERSF